jgi:hypothetical protein
VLENVDPIVWIVVAVVIALVVIALVISAAKKKKRTEHLRGRFGPEYDRTVKRAGSRSKGERELLEREQRRDRMSLKPLSTERRRELLARWEELQASFVDGPESAVRAAEVLLDDAARERGYPDADPDQRLRDLAVDHSDEVDRYRQAAPEHGDRKGKHARQDDADSLRRRMLAARGLFEALLGPDTDRGRSGREERTPEAPFDRVLDGDRRDDVGPRTSDGDRRDATVEHDRHDTSATRDGGTTGRHDASTSRDGLSGDEHGAGSVGDEAVGDRRIADPGRGGPVTDRQDAGVGEPRSDQHVVSDTDEPLAGTPPRSEERTVSPPPPPPPVPDADPSGPVPPEPR